MKIELRLMSSSEVTLDYVLAHNTSRAKFYSGSGERKFDRAELVEEIRQGHKNLTCFFYGIYEINCNSLIGTIKIQSINRKNKTGDVVPFIFNKEYLKYKLGAQAIKLACQIAFDDYELRKIFGGVSKNNVGSIKTFLRANYVVEGIRKDHLLENGVPVDEVLVACFNKKYFNKEQLDQYTVTFEEIFSS